MPNIWVMFNFDMQEGQLVIPLAIPHQYPQRYLTMRYPFVRKQPQTTDPFRRRSSSGVGGGASSSLLVLSSFIPFLYSFNPCPVLFFPFPFLFLFSSFPLSYKTMGSDTAPKRYPFQEFSKDNEFESGMCIMLHGCFEGQGRCSMMFLVFF